MNKPTIPNEVADVIEHLRDRAAFDPAYTNEDIISSVFDPSTSSRFDTLRTVPFDTLMAALVNGYERELTEEQRKQKIREMYREHGYCLGSGNLGIRKGIRDTLSILGIQIEGVNAQ